MKKRALLLLIILIKMLSISPVECADFFSIENRSEANIQPNRIIQDMLMKSESSTVATLSVAPLDADIVNLQDPKIKIPISHLSIAKDVTPHQLNYGKTTVIANNVPLNSRESIKAIINNTGYLRAGTYSTRLEFTKNLRGESIVNVYLLSVEIPKEQDIYTDVSDVRIKIDGNKVFTPDLSVVNESNPRINIKSNVPWSVYLDTTGMDKSNNKYYFQVKGKSPNISDVDELKTELVPNKKYWLASGDITTNSPAALYVEYSQKNKAKYSAPGTFNSGFKYVIEEKRQ